jgi:large subunit ribosomal protein L21e
MAQRVGGFRRKTRGKLSKRSGQKGKISLTNYFQKFNKGDIVSLVAEPAVQKGMYFPRFHGKRGTVKGTSGECYKVSITDGGKEKIMVVHPVHLKKVN